MGYYEVLKFLVNRRLISDDYYSIKTIAKNLETTDDQIRGYCLRMEHEGYAEAKMSGDLIRNWNRVFRASRKALKEYKE